jgi:hypothetical protein
MNTKYKNGGFPPIIYCKPKKEVEKNNKINSKKERLFETTTPQNINIKQLLTENVNKPIILIDNNNEPNLEIIDKI